MTVMQELETRVQSAHVQLEEATAKIEAFSTLKDRLENTSQGLSSTAGTLSKLAENLDGCSEHLRSACTSLSNVAAVLADNDLKAIRGDIEKIKTSTSNQIAELAKNLAAQQDQTASTTAKLAYIAIALSGLTLILVAYSLLS